MRLLSLSLVAAAALAGPARAADPTEDDLTKTLEKAKKDKKYVAVVFTLFN